MSGALVFVAGNPRSGTSWLGKIFDSHPDVLYRHEPDLDFANQNFPFLVEDSQIDDFQAEAARYLGELACVSTIRAVGRTPYFDKSYYSVGRKGLHTAIVNLFKLAEHVPSIGARVGAISIPDLARPDRPIRPVIKSVASLGRLNLYRRAIANGNIVLILRHPCAVLASQIRGLKTGKLSHQMPVKTISSSFVGQKYALDPAYLSDCSIEERVIWTWLVFNEKAVSDLADGHNSIIMTHESLCLEPVVESRRLFDFCNLTWHQQTERYLDSMSQLETKPGYYDLKRNPRDEIDKWKNELSAADIDMTLSILEKSPLSSHFLGSSTP